MAMLACYIAALCDARSAGARRARHRVACIALDQKQAKIMLDYCQATFEHSPILRQLIANRTSDTLELTNGISIEVRPAAFEN